jgi:DNA-binding CsgD family transcriptional regulator
MRKRSDGRLGDMGALVRASKSAQGSAGQGAGGDISGGGVQRRRRLVANFCLMLGEHLGEQKIEGKQGVRGDGEPLSPRERQTLELLLTGHAEKQIASRLSISKHTVHVYVKSLYKRFDVNSRGELLARWVHQ